jgi:hypothetical protein
LEAKNNVRLLTNNIFRWRLAGGTHKKLISTRIATVDLHPGINNSTFKIVLDKPWFAIPDIIQGMDNAYQLRVISEVPVQLGANEFEIEVQLVTSNPLEFFPTELLAVGKEFNKVSSAVANAKNFDFGGFQFTTVFESEGQLGQFAVEFSLDDRAARLAKHCADNGKYGDEDGGLFTRQLRIPFMSDNGGEVKKWISFTSMAEAEMMERIYCDIEFALNLGKASSNMISPNGQTITTGSGLREQIENGNVLQHNGNMTLAQLDDWFTAILKDKRERGQAKVVLSCGIQFAKMFDRMVKADSATFLTVDTLFIRKGDDFRHLD